MRLSSTQHAALVSGARIAKEPRGRRWEDMLAMQLDEAGIAYVREYQFVPARRFRFDFRVGLDLAVEIDGAVHRIKGRFHSDIDKHQLALLHGFRVLRVSPMQVRSGSALNLIRLLQLSGRHHLQASA
jgi:very-short-patch-repair endonuclease